MQVSAINRISRIILLERQRCSNNVRNLKLRAFDEIRALPELHIDVSCLRSLTIDLTDNSGNTSSNVSMLDDFDIFECPMACWLLTTISIESLTLIQHPPNFNFNFLGFLDRLRFSKLTELHLKYLTTPRGTLYRFINAQRETLVSLRIEEPVAEPRQWNPLQQDISNAVSAVFETKTGTELVLTDSFRPDRISVPRWWSDPYVTKDAESVVRWWSNMHLYRFGKDCC